jgi:archaemetzincin
MNEIPNGRLSLPPNETVVVVPMDGPPAGEMVQLVVDLQREGIRASLVDAIGLPESAYDRARSQYRAESLLAAARDSDGRRMLAVIARDMYAEGSDFAFGIGESAGRTAVISLFRLRADPDYALLHARVLKEAVHQLGRTLGLEPCENRLCVMHLSNSLADLDRKTSRLCEACLLQASRHGRTGR